MSRFPRHLMPAAENIEGESDAFRLAKKIQESYADKLKEKRDHDMRLAGELANDIKDSLQTHFKDSGIACDFIGNNSPREFWIRVDGYCYFVTVRKEEV